MVTESFICRKCWITFPNRSAMQNHVKRKHQLEVKTQFKNRTINHIKHDMNELFPCLCDSKCFLYLLSLQKHAKKCDEQAATTVTTIEDSMSTIELSFEAKATIESMSMKVEDKTQVPHENQLTL